VEAAVAGWERRDGGGQVGDLGRGEPGAGERPLLVPPADEEPDDLADVGLDTACPTGEIAAHVLGGVGSRPVGPVSEGFDGVVLVRSLDEHDVPGHPQEGLVPGARLENAQPPQLLGLRR